VKYLFDQLHVRSFLSSPVVTFRHLHILRTRTPILIIDRDSKFVEQPTVWNYKFEQARFGKLFSNSNTDVHVNSRASVHANEIPVIRIRQATGI
jgi:hypothetical protein